MFDLPKKCFVNKFIPKKVFYEKVGVSSKVKDEFVNLVDKSGKFVPEVEPWAGKFVRDCNEDICKN